MTTQRRVDESNPNTYQLSPSEPVSAAVVRAVGEVSGRTTVEGPDGLPPLYEAIDPDALHELYASRRDPPVVQFSYAGYTVTIDETRQVTVTED
jgi:hypothetical protein